MAAENNINSSGSELSEKDKKQPTLKELDLPFEYKGE